MCHKTTIDIVTDFLAVFHRGPTPPMWKPALKLPYALNRLYTSQSNWTSDTSFHVVHWPSTLEKSNGMIFDCPCPDGWIVFAQENQGVWFAACPPGEGSDTEVAICSNAGIEKFNSLNTFLAWLLLQESAWSASDTENERPPIDNDCWNKFGFTDVIDLTFNPSSSVIQLYSKFRLNHAKNSIAFSGGNGSCQIALQAT
jgi:uncharacterized protein YqkB